MPVVVICGVWMVRSFIPGLNSTFKSLNRLAKLQKHWFPLELFFLMLSCQPNMNCLIFLKFLLYIVADMHNQKHADKNADQNKTRLKI